MTHHSIPMRQDGNYSSSMLGGRPAVFLGLLGGVRLLGQFFLAFFSALGGLLTISSHGLAY